MASRKDKEALARLCEGYVDDLTTFKTEVLKLLDKTSVTERRPSFVRVKAILGRGTAFRLLDDDLLRPDLPWEMDGFQVNVLLEAMSAYSLYTEASNLPEYASLRAIKPMELAEMFRWVDLVHPLNGRLIPTPGRRTYGPIISSISTMFSSLIRKKEDEFVQLAWKDPHIIALVMDLWLHYPRYLLHYGEELSETICIITASAISTFNGLAATEGGEGYIVARLLAMVGGRHRYRHILRLFSEQIAFIDRINIRSKFEFFWKLQFALVAAMVQSSEFAGITAPLCFFQSLLIGYQRALGQPDNETMISLSADAAEILDRLVCMAINTTNLRRAIRAGVYGVLFDVERTWGKGDNLFSASVNHLESSLTIASILRAFHRQHGELLHPPEQPDARRSFIEDRFKSLLSTYRMVWQQYTKAKSVSTWKLLFPCNNANAVTHEAEVRACPCGEAFYCSKKCQHEHWKTSHRDQCRRADGVWGTQGDITLGDAVFLFESALRVVVCNEEKMAKELACTRWVNNPNPKSGLFMIELTNPPTPLADGDFDWTLDEDSDDGSSDEDDEGGEEEDGGGETGAADDELSSPRKDRGVESEIGRTDDYEGPHIAAISAWYCIGELYPEQKLPFKYDFALRRPVVKD
ncbi:hypothetical protein K525DRAFT_255174 [Schizophyllum commune Loenen D]|nr:hypothetical protein K525DRAFT_255174 [Schizophyllum commune Loenen D]